MLSKTLSSTEEHLLKHTAGMLYIAGIDTVSSTRSQPCGLLRSQTVASLMHFFRIMLDRPDMQARAAAELDSVLPQGELPTLNDEARLPYTTALVLESMRYQPLAPQACHHALSEVDPPESIDPFCLGNPA